MPDEFNEELIEELEPLDPGLIDPDEALDLSDAALAGDEDATLIISPPPPPLGQTIAWDFENYKRRSSDLGGPQMVRGEAALRQWIEKCLRTHQGAHLIHPEGYGMETPITEFIGKNRQDIEVGELEEMVKEALTFHPVIKEVSKFTAIWDEEDELTGGAALTLKFVVVRDDDTSLRVETSFGGQPHFEEAFA